MVDPRYDQVGAPRQHASVRAQRDIHRIRWGPVDGEHSGLVLAQAHDSLGRARTDGERVIASYASDGLYCYDFSGNELWRRDDLGHLADRQGAEHREPAGPRRPR